MKIDKTGSSQGASKSKKSGKSQKSDGTFGSTLKGLDGTKDTAGASTTQSIAQVDALLQVQAAENPTERAARKRMHQRSEKILDVLDSIRVAMLTGEVTIGHMVDVADVVASHRERITDPTLTAIMDEIDLRAQVELAKLKMAGAKI